MKTKIKKILTATANTGIRITGTIFIIMLFLKFVKLTSPLFDSFLKSMNGYFFQNHVFFLGSLLFSFILVVAFAYILLFYLIFVPTFKH